MKPARPGDRRVPRWYRDGTNFAIGVVVLAAMWCAKRVIEALTYLKHRETRLPKPQERPVSSIRKALDRYGR